MARSIAALIITSFFLSGCALFSPKQSNSVEEVEEAIEAPVLLEEEPVGELGVTDSKAKVASIFAYALIQNNVLLLNDNLPDVAMARMIAEEETKGLTDKEVQEKIIEPLITRFTKNFELLQNAINENDIDRAKLKYKSYKWETTAENIFAIAPMLIVLDYGGKDFTIPVTASNVDSKSTLFEIIKTTNVFSE